MEDVWRALPATTTDDDDLSPPKAPHWAEKLAEKIDSLPNGMPPSPRADDNHPPTDDIADPTLAPPFAGPTQTAQDPFTGQDITVEAGIPKGVPADAIDLTGNGGLCKRIITPGDPSAGMPFGGAEVQVHYVGTLLSDGSRFDSSRSRPGNFAFTIGMGAVIRGWDEGVMTMHKGEVAELFCRADYGYGGGGSPPKIPGGAALKFEVELLSWAEKEKSRWQYEPSEKLQMARELKAEGGSLFKAGEWAAAYDKYNRGAGWTEHSYEFFEEAAKGEANDLELACLLNMAQCALKLQDWHGAASACEKALAVDSLPTASKVKALFRRDDPLMIT